ncbi:MAG: HAMP domain-containing histidine kinase [Anaerolineae bacterium]|nr:HAMP domain-containing histidine kinase [Anaerolineae bacterium]
MARLKPKVFWQTPFIYAFLVCLLLELVWLLFLSRITPQFTLPEYTGGIIISLPSTALLFGLLLRLPEGALMRHISYELLAFAAVLFILFAGMWMAFVLHDQGQIFRSLTPAEQQEFGNWNWESFVPLLLPPFLVAIAVMYAGTRVLVRLYRTWNHMREKRLIWEITHTQLNLLVLVMAVLFLLLAVYQILTVFSQQAQPGFKVSTFVYKVVINVLAAAGVLGMSTAVMLICIILPAMVVSYFAARRITRRIDILVEATQQIRQGHYDTRIPVIGQDEVAQLQENFNGMVEQLAATRTALETERDTVSSLLESRRRLFADISHELRTPVATIRSYLESSAPDIDIIQREVLRLQGLIDDVFTLAKSDFDQLQYNIAPVDLKPILERTAQVARQVAWQTRKVEVILELPAESPVILADGERVEQILYNLLRNAIRHTLPGGLIMMRTRAEASFTCIEVQDTGEGIPEDQLARIWERFYRTPETRASDTQGSGLGLALVREMTEAMHGTVAVHSKVGEGSCFCICLPCAGENQS